MTENKKQELTITRAPYFVDSKKLKQKVGEMLKEIELVEDNFTGEITVIFNQGGVRNIQRYVTF